MYDILSDYERLVSKCTYVRNQEANQFGVSAQIDTATAVDLTKKLQEYRTICRKLRKTSEEIERANELKLWLQQHRVTL